MLQRTTRLFTATVLLGMVTIMACQKQGDVQTRQPKNISLNTITTSRVDGIDYKIPKDTAAKWGERFRALNAKEFNNQMPTALTLPIGGIQQLLDEAAAHNTELGGIRLYLSVNGKGGITAMYVPVDKDKKEDILYYNNEANTAELDVLRNTIQVYDGASGCTISITSIK